MKGRKRCKQCRELFYPSNSLVLCCSPACALLYAREKGTGIEVSRKRAMRERREALRPLSWYTKRAQDTFNAFIRLRDEIAGHPCISSGKFTQGQWHAGHYKTTASRPDLRFNEDNCHRQTAEQNNWKSGNVSGYREGLIKRIGEERLLVLEGPPTIMRYRREDLERIKSHYGKLINKLASSVDQ
jgi:hypothetical protein